MLHKQMLALSVLAGLLILTQFPSFVCSSAAHANSGNMHSSSKHKIQVIDFHSTVICTLGFNSFLDCFDVG